MNADRYMKVLLTVIAACLLVLCLAKTGETQNVYDQIGSTRRPVRSCVGLVYGTALNSMMVKPVATSTGTGVGLWRVWSDGTVEQLMKGPSAHAGFYSLMWVAAGSETGVASSWR